MIILKTSISLPLMLCIFSVKYSSIQTHTHMHKGTKMQRHIVSIYYWVRSPLSRWIAPIWRNFDTTSDRKSSEETLLYCLDSCPRNPDFDNCKILCGNIPFRSCSLLNWTYVGLMQYPQHASEILSIHHKRILSSLGPTDTLYYPDGLIHI